MRSAEPLDAVHVRGDLPVGVLAPAEHGGRVFKVDADFPVAASCPDASCGETSLVVRFSVVQGALLEAGAGEAAQQAARGWLTRTVECLAATGFATVDFASPFASGPSPYEAAAGVIRTGVDPLRHVRGYQWLTILGPGHIEALGGLHVLDGAPVEEVEWLCDGRVLLCLRHDARTIAAPDLAALRRFLRPLLPEGLLSLDDHQGGPTASDPSAGRPAVRVPPHHQPMGPPQREPVGVDDPLARLPSPEKRRLAVRVTKDALRQIRGGHPWVFESSITSCPDDGRAGDLAVVFDSERRFQGIGLYDPASPIRVRMLHHGPPVPIDDTWWRQRFTDALDRRSGLLASTETTGFRCVHGENDGLPGLVVDRYGAALVVKLYSAAWVPHLRTVVAVLQELLAPEVVVVRVSRALQRGGVPDIADGTALVGEAPVAPVLFRENGLTLEADIVAGQKTGHFLDQRENRRLVGAEAAGARVLDVFACTGGFSLSAAAGGARSVCSVDLSAKALDTARSNFACNRHLPPVRRCRLETTVGDAFEVMAALRASGERFGTVVVDPPSFAHTRAGVGGALRAYRRLTDLAVQLVEDGGLLVQASCSSRVAASDFFAQVHRGAGAAGCELEEVRRTGHPVDHPIGFQHGAYLKAIFAHVHRLDRPGPRWGM